MQLRQANYNNQFVNSKQCFGELSAVHIWAELQLSSGCSKCHLSPFSQMPGHHPLTTHKSALPPIPTSLHCGWAQSGDKRYFKNQLHLQKSPDLRDVLCRDQAEAAQSLPGHSQLQDQGSGFNYLKISTQSEQRREICFHFKIPFPVPEKAGIAEQRCYLVLCRGSLVTAFTPSMM